MYLNLSIKVIHDCEAENYNKMRQNNNINNKSIIAMNQQFCYFFGFQLTPQISEEYKYNVTRACKKYIR